MGFIPIELLYFFSILPLILPFRYQANTYTHLRILLTSVFIFFAKKTKQKMPVTLNARWFSFWPLSYKKVMFLSKFHRDKISGFSRRAPSAKPSCARPTTTRFYSCDELNRDVEGDAFHEIDEGYKSCKAWPRRGPIHERRSVTKSDTICARAHMWENRKRRLAVL